MVRLRVLCDDDPPPVSLVDEVHDRAARKLSSTRVRAKTIPPRKLTRDERELAREIDYPSDVDRPRTREDCASMPRPCPFVSCAHHLFLDVNPQTGALKLNFPHLDPDEMAESCSLDVADAGPHTLEEVGALTNVTRERARQIETTGLYEIKRLGRDRIGLPPAREEFGNGRVSALPAAE